MLVAEADLVRGVSIGGESELRSRLNAHLGQSARGIDLTDRLSKPGGRHLHRHIGLPDRIDRQLVVTRQGLWRSRPAGAPDLHEVRMGEHVEEPAPRRIRDRLEVLAPDLVGRRRAPSVVAGVIDGPVGDEVDRADHVVERPSLDQRRQLGFSARQVVELEPELDRIAGCSHPQDELDVVVQAVGRVLDPEGMTPDGERLTEAIDVLGETELGDAV